MAKRKGGGGVNYSGAQKSNDCLNETSSGLVHTADSQGGSSFEGGQFIPHFGPPGDPTSKSSMESDSGPKRGNPFAELMMGSKKGRKG